MSGIYEFNGDELHGDGREVYEPKPDSSPVPAAAPQPTDAQGDYVDQLAKELLDNLRRNISDDRRRRGEPSAPQAESVPSGTDAAHKWLDAKVGRPFSERHEFIDHNDRTWNVATLLSEYAAALAAERDKLQAELNETIEDAVCGTKRILELERSNSLLRERITAAEGLLRDFRDCYEFGDYVDSRIDDYFKEKP